MRVEFSLNHDQTVAVWIIIGLAALFGPSFWRRRDNAAFNFTFLLIAIILGFVVYMFMQTNDDWVPYAPYAAMFTTVFLYRIRPKKGRSMPAKVRRRVIARWEISTGKKFNSQTHEIDHVIPFSKGGNETEDNLRVIERKKNRSKGAKSPWWDVLGR